MYSDKFEQAFSDFLDSDAYDAVEEQLFVIVRASFAAGWQAAIKMHPISFERAKETG